MAIESCEYFTKNKEIGGKYWNSDQKYGLLVRGWRTQPSIVNFRMTIDTSALWPGRPGCGVPACFSPAPAAPGGRAGDRKPAAVAAGLLVSSKEQKILGLSNHRTGNYSFPINAANTSSNFHLILICSASYTRTCSTKTRSSSLVSVFASLY